MRRTVPARLVVWFATLVTLGSGLLNLYSVLGPPLPERGHLLRAIFHAEFLKFSRSLTLLLGFALVITAINIYRRKKRALQLAIAIALASVVFQLAKGLDYEEATLSLLFAVALYAVRGHFTVRSSIPDFREVWLRAVAAVGLALSYGILGFWLLDRREFGIKFTLADSIRRTLLSYSLVGDPGVVPHTAYARWFLESLYLIGASAVLYAMYSTFRPVVYEYSTLPHERQQVKALLERYGRASLDYFKLWPDKSYFFSKSRESVIAYRVGRNVALALGDPTGPDAEFEGIVSGFAAMCTENGWRFAFYQVLPEFLPHYLKLGLKKLKVGEEAIVELPLFTLEGKSAKHFRYRIHCFERDGVRSRYYAAPADEQTLERAREVSEGWLQISGRRERTFTVGQFHAEYVRSTPLFTAEDSTGRILAFVNLIPSYRRGEATIDLMRRRPDAPNGIVDYLFVKLLLMLGAQGYEQFNLGMAPMSAKAERAEAGPEERAVHYFFQRLNFLFSYQGLKEFKAKFATRWEPLYIVYQSVLHLPEIGLALIKIAELPPSSEE